MPKFSRLMTGALAVSLTCALVALAGTAIGAPTSRGKADKGVLYAAVTHTVNGTEYLAGNNSDKLLGAGAATYAAKVGASGKITATVTLFTKTGSLTGKGSATLVPGAKGAVTFTGGVINLTKGAGAQAGHSFSGTFTGTGSLTTGQYVFNYKGTYK
jgi:hypothetical protein